MPTNGNVKRSTQIPNHVGIAAASSWPPSFSHQRSPRKSSIAPTVTATAAPSSSPRVSRSSGRNASDGTKIPRKSASPPSRGIGRRLSRRPPGVSTDAEQPRHPADRRREQHHDDEGDERAPDDLQVVAENVEDVVVRRAEVSRDGDDAHHASPYFVP